MIREVTSSVEKRSEPSIIPPLDENVLAEKSQMAKTQKPLTTADFGDEIPEMEEALVNEMWESVRKHVGEMSVGQLSTSFYVGFHRSRSQ